MFFFLHQNHNYFHICRICKINFVEILKESFPNFTIRSLKVEHYKLQHQNALITCLSADCKELFANPQDMKCHFKLNHLNDRLRCSFCPYVSKKLEYLNFHVDTNHQEKVSLKFLCQVNGCTKAFSTLATLHEHGRRSHTKKRYKRGPKECPYCEKMVKNLSFHVWNNHLRLKQHNCLQCNKAFQTNGHLKRHVESVHNGIRHPVPCPICGKLLGHKASLTTHIQAVHEKVRHKCTQCEKEYFRKQELLCHIKSFHKGIKARCRFCLMEFGRAPDRNRHEKQRHKAEMEALD